MWLTLRSVRPGYPTGKELLRHGLVVVAVALENLLRCQAPPSVEEQIKPERRALCEKFVLVFQVARVVRDEIELDWREHRLPVCREVGPELLPEFKPL